MDPQPVSPADDSAPPSARRRETQLRLLDAATEVFSELGLQGASVETICARAGFSRGAFYSNFSSKEGLFVSLLEREFERRAAELLARSATIEPALRARDSEISPAEAAQYILEFFSPGESASMWIVLETEFKLLTMRDPSLAPDHQQFLERFYGSISSEVERVITAAGRRFSLPVERALPVLIEVYEHALRATIVGGPDAAGGIKDVGERLAELVFALTEPHT